MGRARNQSSRSESHVAWFILGLLVVITAGVFFKQARYRPDSLVSVAYESRVPGQALPGFAGGLNLADSMPGDMTVLNPIESFNPGTLSEKINGKAELYLSAGFVGLRAQRFSKQDDPAAWMEVFVYDMGTLRQAFAVFSAQRRAEAEPLDLTMFAYRTKNAVFYVRGRYYVEIIASAASTAMTEAMLSFGRAFVSKNPAPKDRIGELALFPKERMQPASEVLFVLNAFGFEGLTNLFTARYELDGVVVTGFLSDRKTAEDAKNTAEAYEAFLTAYDGRNVPLKHAFPGAVLIEIFDRFELIFHEGRYVAGVHDAASQEVAEKLGRMIRERLGEASG